MHIPPRRQAGPAPGTPPGTGSGGHAGGGPEGGANRGARPFQPPLALVLGTGDIGSAIGRALFLAGFGVAMLRDPGTPVLRRGMAFDDALEEGFAELDGVWASRAPAVEALAPLAAGREAVAVAELDLAVVIAAWAALTGASVWQDAGGRPPDVLPKILPEIVPEILPEILVDARMRKYAAPADLRPLAGCALGIGPGFAATGNVDLAIETLPGREGALVARGPTAAPTGRAVPLAGAGEERFVYAPGAGPWTPALGIGAWVSAGAPIGLLGPRPVLAPIDGAVRGMVRAMPNGIARGSKLLELDPRRDAPCTGVPPRARRIAEGVVHALATLLPAAPLPARRHAATARALTPEA